MPRPDLSMSREDCLALLREPHVGVLSTIDAKGFPHSVGIYYVPRETAGGLELWTWVYGKSQKTVNVERTPRASLLVEAGTPYQDLRGVLVRGSARVSRDYEEVVGLGKELYTRYFEPRLGIPVEAGPIENIKRQSHKRVALILAADRIASWNHASGPVTGGAP